MITILNLLKNRIFQLVLAALVGLMAGFAVTSSIDNTTTTEKITQLTQQHQVELQKAIETERNKQTSILASNTEQKTVYVDRVITVTKKDGTKVSTVIKDKIVDNTTSTIKKELKETVKTDTKIVSKTEDKVVSKTEEKTVVSIPKAPRFSLGVSVNTPIVHYSDVANIGKYDWSKTEVDAVVGVRLVNNLWILENINIVKGDVQFGLKYEITL